MTRPRSFWPTRARRLVAAVGVHLALALALLAGAPARAEPAADCPPTPAPPTEGELQALRDAARDRGVLWRVDKDGRSSWLYGTIHVGRREWAIPGPEVARALRAVDTLALELDPRDPGVQAGLAQGLAAMRRPVLPEALTGRLARRARDDCLPEAAFGALPSPAQALILSTLVGRRDGLDPAYGIDALLAAFGHARLLEVVSLETPALQLAVLDMGSDEATVAWVEGTLGELERGTARSRLAGLAAAWADGDLDAMTLCPMKAEASAGVETGAEAGAECAGSAQDRAFERRVVDDRNPGLAAAIDALHAGGQRVFAAVGSLHMTGPLGLPALLAARGYRVERVRFERP